MLLSESPGGVVLRPTVDIELSFLGPAMCVHPVSHSVRCAGKISGVVVVDPPACFDPELRTTIAHLY